jgi:hypothetical protein
MRRRSCNDNTHVHVKETAEAGSSENVAHAFVHTRSKPRVNYARCIHLHYNTQEHCERLPPEDTADWQHSWQQLLPPLSSHASPLRSCQHAWRPRSSAHAHGATKLPAAASTMRLRGEAASPGRQLV